MTAEDIAELRSLIASHPEASRWMLSKKVCEAWDWRQANGALQSMVCRGLMLMLREKGSFGCVNASLLEAFTSLRMTVPLKSFKIGFLFAAREYFPGG